MLSNLDIIAVIWFFTAWILSSMLSIYNKQNLISKMYVHQLNWMKAMIKRDDRLVDLKIISNLLRSTMFFASTSILIVAGLVAVLGYGEKALKIIHTLPFVVETNQQIWVIKTFLLLFIFIHSFFKFTWVMRQFNFASVLLVSSPQYKEGSNKEIVKSCAKNVRKTSVLISNSARHFNFGIRSYYFGLAALSWYVNPMALIFSTTLVVLVLYRREFLSKTLDLIS